MTRRILLLLALAATPLAAQTGVDTAGAGALIDEAMNKSQVMANLEYLTDVIGPRLTGSAAMKRANDWTEAQFKVYGLTQLAGVVGVRRHVGARARSPSASSRPSSANLTAHSWAWTAGTGGKTLTGPVVMVDVSTPESLAVYQGKVKGAWLMLRPPANIWNPDGPPMTAADSAAAQKEREARAAAMRATPTDTSAAARLARRQFAVDRNYLLKNAGALGVLTDGSKEFGLMTMSGSPYSISPLPNVVIAHEDYAQFSTACSSAASRRRVSGRIDNTLGTKPVTAVEHGRPRSRAPSGPTRSSSSAPTSTAGTSAPAPPTTPPARWSCMEAARVIDAERPQAEADDPVHPLQRRGGGAARARWPTPRKHAAETGQRPGGAGARQRHRDDHGAGAAGPEPGRPALDRTCSPRWRRSVRPRCARPTRGAPTTSRSLPYGVPGWNFDQETRGYNHTHHSQVDTYDHAVPGDLMQASAVMAVTALRAGQPARAPAARTGHPGDAADGAAAEPRAGEEVAHRSPGKRSAVRGSTPAPRFAFRSPLVSWSGLPTRAASPCRWSGTPRGRCRSFPP